MRIDSDASDSVPLDTLADRAFRFLGFALLCGGAMRAFSAGAHWWKIISTNTPGDAEQLAIASICRMHLLTGVTCLVAGGLFVGKRRIIGGLLVVVAVIAYLAFVDSP